MLDRIKPPKIFLIFRIIFQNNDFRKGVLFMKNKKFWTYENKLVIIVFFTIGFVFFDRLAINYLFPMISVDLGLNYTQLGLLGAALALTWSVSGPLGDSFQIRLRVRNRC